MTRRMFAAVLPPPEAVEHLDEFLDVRRAAREAAGLRWSAPEQVHVTLAFMAEVRERALDDLAERLAAAAGRRTAWRARIAGGGAFPHPAGAKVLWAGLGAGEADGAAELDRLAGGARAAATTAGVEVDGQRFRPHLTVARLGRPAEVTRWVRLLDAYVGPWWTVDALSLVESHLGVGPRRRPRHDVVGVWPLRPPGSCPAPRPGSPA